MKIETLKAVAVYGNVTFIVVAGFWVLFQLATRSGLDPTVGAASIFAGFVGMAVQFLTGQEIATRANRAAAGNFAAGVATPVPVANVLGDPAAPNTLSSRPAQDVKLEEPTDG